MANRIKTMRISIYGQFDATHEQDTLILNGPSLCGTPTGDHEIWIAGAGSKAATGIPGNIWVIRTPNGTWHWRDPGSGQRGRYFIYKGKWATTTSQATPEQNATLEAARTAYYQEISI